MKNVLIAIFLLLLLSLTVLHAAITVSYVPQTHLIFRKGNEVPTSSFNPTGFSASKFVAHLGTITIHTNGEPIVRPILVGYGTSNDFTFTGPLSQNWADTRTGFQIDGVATNKRTPFPIWFGDSEFILDDGTIYENPYVVDIYLRSNHNSSLYMLGASYTMVVGSLGSFNIKMKNINNWDYYYVPINGQTIPTNGAPPATPVPLPVGGSGVPIPSVPYGDEPPLDVIYGLSILDNVPVNLEQAYSKPVKIATAQMLLENAVQTETYGVEISFTNNKSGSDFKLHLDGLQNLHAIPYKLRFLEQEVIKGSRIEWEPLSIPLTTQNIYITDINQTEAKKALSGTYTETIWVEIFPIE
ncbi:MAG TPA: hypothetical protein VJ869_03125 [Sphaerochaeta sp.]|nr:hypothetical protein [Sphaerochaeta sp.]